MTDRKPYERPEVRELDPSEVKPLTVLFQNPLFEPTKRLDPKALYEWRCELGEQYPDLSGLVMCSNDGCGERSCEECRATEQLYLFAQAIRKRAIHEAIVTVEGRVIEEEATTEYERADAVQNAANALKQLEADSD